MRSKPAQFAIMGAAALFLIVIFGQVGSNRGNLPAWVPKSAADFTSRISGSLGRGNLKSVMETSEKLWRKTVTQRHAYRERFPNLEFFPARDSASYFTTPITVWDLVPASYNCPWEVERIGAMGDGGKWVCGMSRYEKTDRPCIIYSFGIQNESSFEQEILERTNCEIWGYDYSVDEFGPQLLPEYLPRTHFLRAAIGATTDPKSSPPSYSIQDLMKENGHDYIDILKIDIEYAEFNVLSSLNAYTLDVGTEMPIGQMLMELHLFSTQGITLPIFMDWWESMENRGFRPSWTEPNLLSVTLGIDDRMPRLTEYTFLNVKDINNKLFT